MIIEENKYIRHIFKITLSVLAFLCTDVHGQNLNYLNVIPPSPNASSFLKFGEFPISYYTGVPSASIDLHTIVLKDLKFPIKLRYNASGIKVDEEAGRTGLGWSLDCAGVITQTVKGRYNDFYDDVYFYNGTNNKLKDLNNIYTFDKYTIGTYSQTLPFTLPNGMSKYDLWSGIFGEDVSCGAIELAPDEFNYNFMGYSGKFIFSHSGVIIKESEDNLKIIPNKTANGKLISWIIYDGKGNKYLFNQAEQTYISDWGINRGTFNSSFYLSEIQSLNGTKIEILYKKKSSYLGKFHRTEDSRLSEPLLVDYTSYEVVYLDKIIFPNGQIRFDYLFDRDDYAPEARLANIYIDENGIQKLSWNFRYEYFVANNIRNEIPTLSKLNVLLNNGTVTYYNDNWNTKRLKLKEVKRVDNKSNEEKYKFEYNENNLPTKLSASIDHWGYYNGVNNLSLVPSIVQNTSQIPGIISLDYAGRDSNREPNEYYGRAFLLSKIIYPTGGYSTFDYEANRYKLDDFENDPYKKNLMYKEATFKLEEGVGWNNVPIEFVNTVPFSLPTSVDNGGLPKFSVRIKIIVDDSYNIRNGGEKLLDMKIEKDGTPGTIPWSFVFQAPYLPTQINDNNRVYERVWNDVQANGGAYKIKVSGSLRTYIRSTEVIVTRYIEPSEILSTTKFNLGGGFRISNLKAFENGTQLSHKKFIYTLDGSQSEFNTTGRLMFYPRYRKDHMSIGINGLRGEGYSVGYSKVHVKDLDLNGNELGKTVFEYINKPDKNLFYTWAETAPSERKAFDENPTGIGSYKFSENGTLLKEINYKRELQDYIKIKQTQYDYSFLGDGPNITWGILKSINTFYNGVCLEPTTPYQPPNDLASGYLYPAIRPIKTLLSQRKETFYFNNDSLETMHKFEYHPSNLLLQKETVNLSNGNKNSTLYTYPIDKSNSGNIYEKMTLMNIIDNPVEERYTFNDKYETLLKEYMLINNVPYMSKISRNQANSGEYYNIFEYLKYDSYGNPLEVKKSDGPITTYVWGNNGQSLIGEIVNASHAQVVEALGGSSNASTVFSQLNSSAVTDSYVNDKLNEIRTNLTDAQVRTYTYSPLAGVTSHTDSKGQIIKYEYDGFQRLQYIKDQKGNIIKSYDYHLRP